MMADMETGKTTWYLTKYAGTKGIEEIHGGKVVSLVTGEYLSHGQYCLYKIGFEVFASLVDAKRDALKRVNAAIAAAHRKTTKLEKLKASYQEGT